MPWDFQDLNLTNRQYKYDDTPMVTKVAPIAIITDLFVRVSLISNGHLKDKKFFTCPYPGRDLITSMSPAILDDDLSFKLLLDK